MSKEPASSSIVWAERTFPKEVLDNLRKSHEEWEIEILLEQVMPLRELYPEEFQRYYDLFIRYYPKTPCHVKSSYDGGFICMKGKKKSGDDYERPCYADLVAKMLDYQRWKATRDQQRHRDGCWIALREPRKARLKAIDFDKKSTSWAITEDGPLEQRGDHPALGYDAGGTFAGHQANLR